MSLRAVFLGQLDYILNETSITSSLSEKACGLLCYLAMNPGKVHYREQLSQMFWGDSNVHSSGSSLRYTLWIIRKNLESDGCRKYIVNPSKNTIKFLQDRSDMLDVFRFRELCGLSKEEGLTAQERIGMLEEACRLYGDTFLKDFYLKDAPAFNDWVFFEREELQRLYFEVETRLSEQYEKLGACNEAIAPLNKLIKIDPLQEDLYYRLIHLYYISGYRTTAIEVYHKLKKTLREELNISPMKDIQTIYRQICMAEDKTTIRQSVPQEPEIQGENGEERLISLYESGFHMQFFITENIQKIHELIGAFDGIKADNMPVTIEISKKPGKRIAYEGFFEIVEGYRNMALRKRKGSGTDAVLSEIDRIKNGVFLGKYVLFQALCKLFHRTAEQKMIFLIYRFHLLDDETVDFISFLTRKCGDMDIRVFGLYDSGWENRRFELFIREFGEEKKIEFIRI